MLAVVFVRVQSFSRVRLIETVILESLFAVRLERIREYRTIHQRLTREVVTKFSRWCVVSRQYEVCFGLCEVAGSRLDIVKICPVRERALDLALNCCERGIIA